MKKIPKEEKKIKGTDTAISLIDQITPEIIQMKPILIVDTKSLTEATETLSKLNKYLDALTKDKETITKPINESLKVIRAKYKPLETSLSEAIEMIRKSMGSYQTTLMANQRMEEQKIADRIGEGRGKLSLESATKKIEAIEVPVAKIATDNGSIKFRETKCFEVVDISKVPIKYHLPDEVAIRTAMKAGIEFEGVKYWSEQTPINNRN
jgi:hypothetical protein